MTYFYTYDNVPLPRLETFYLQWLRGERSKKDIELTEFGDAHSQAKAITEAWRVRLGKETERKSRLRVRHDHMREVLNDLLGMTLPAGMRVRVRAALDDDGKR